MVLFFDHFELSAFEDNPAMVKYPGGRCMRTNDVVHEAEVNVTHAFRADSTAHWIYAGGAEGPSPVAVRTRWQLLRTSATALDSSDKTEKAEPFCERLKPGSDANSASLERFAPLRTTPPRQGTQAAAACEPTMLCTRRR